MEISCSRCHQPVAEDSCYCPTCGLPQLVYSSEGNGGEAQQEQLHGVVTDASVVEWRPALRAAMLLALPAGLLSSAVSRTGLLGLFWMVAAAAWAVTLYVRKQRPAWITAGAGARIGLVTGIMAAALAFTVTGVALLTQRFAFHQAAAMDGEWQAFADAVFQKSAQVYAQMGISDQAPLLAQKYLMLSPEGHAGWVVFNIAGWEGFLVICSAAGGALGARLIARSRRRQA